ncbi:MAG: type II toxin-antitoxin system RelE/ParE family toxin [Rickettsiales bacterium]|nr:type II toxin-antitoxin system RelE/ParE family toxin [Rickettsiales bacterium]
MIKSFSCRETETIFNGILSRKFPLEIQARAERKLRMLDASGKIDDLRIPPSNRLEALSGKRRGQWSVRINDRYRICFEWNADGAHNVEITDYH